MIFALFAIAPRAGNLNRAVNLALGWPDQLFPLLLSGGRLNWWPGGRAAPAGAAPATRYYRSLFKPIGESQRGREYRSLDWFGWRQSGSISEQKMDPNRPLLFVGRPKGDKCTAGRITRLERISSGSIGCTRKARSGEESAQLSLREKVCQRRSR